MISAQASSILQLQISSDNMETLFYKGDEYLMDQLKGKIAIVTGAGKGIGREAALAIAAEGAAVAAVARTQADLDETVKMIEDNGGSAIAISHDLTVGAEVQAMVGEIMNKYGKIDILVNNAGGYPSEIYRNIEHQAIKLWEWTEEQWDQIIKTNVRIPFLCMKHVLPIMISQRSGKVVSVSSRMGRIASQMGAYAVAKGSIITMTKTAAIQTQEYGIQVNAVAPGIVDTPGQRVYNHSVGQDGVPMGSAADVAKAILYLLCDAPPVMTGQSIDLFTTV
jgi:NAD(P)-dependent dehydrogenase (short-subunit alcohol dehydrogenase family)